ncbi:MAG: hypothetical protein AB3N21_11590 [Ruegeria sp.]|uniref:hypothetical protein n=1 Tax=Ruegeria sp. TaxID=1879320 RepID=UPI00349EC8BB
MADTDYKKRIADIKKWNKDQKGVEKRRTGYIETTRKKLISLEDKLRKDSIVWKGYFKHLYQLNDQYVKLAEPLVKAQADLKAATKAKNAAKVAEIKKQIGETEKKLKPVEKKFQKNYDEMKKLDDAIKKLVVTAEKL